jgi:hypothetical protein
MSVPCALQRPECAQAFKSLTDTVKVQGEVIGALRERVAGLEARLAVASAIGAILGAGAATLLVRLVAP